MLRLVAVAAANDPPTKDTVDALVRRYCLLQLPPQPLQQPQLVEVVEASVQLDCKRWVLERLSRHSKDMVEEVRLGSKDCT